MATDRDFIAELYLGLRRMLVEYGEAEARWSTGARGVTDDLAFTAYMVAASRHPEPPVGPELLEALRSTIARVLSGTDQAPAA